MADKEKPARRQSISTSIDSVVAGLMSGPAAPPPSQPVQESESIPKTRKKRKDATGKKSDYHQGTSTLTVRLPDEEAQAVKDLAAASGQSTNAWLQNLIRSALESDGTP